MVLEAKEAVVKRVPAFIMILALVVLAIYVINWDYARVAAGGQNAINSLVGDPDSTPPLFESSDEKSDLTLINDDNPLARGFKPQELVSLYELVERPFDLIEESICMKASAAQAMQEMFWAAQADGEFGFIITSGYRSYAEQTVLFTTNQNGYVARPGASEHQSGLAFDVGVYYNENIEQTAQYRWLVEHCGEFGFILRYPPDKEAITGVPFEPWHFRYVGVPYAQEIMGAGITLEEYLGH